MAASLTFKQILRSIKFPVYKLPNEDYYTRDGILFLDELVVDDRNQKGETLGSRRLQTPHKLKKLNTMYEEYIDLIRENPTTLIDSNGNIFSYEKTQFEKIKSYSIRKKELKGDHTLIWLRSVNFPFLVARPPIGKAWAQVLTLQNHPWLLWGFSEEKLPEFRRKI